MLGDFNTLRYCSYCRHHEMHIWSKLRYFDIDLHTLYQVRDYNQPIRSMEMLYILLYYYNIWKW